MNKQMQGVIVINKHAVLRTNPVPYGLSAPTDESSYQTACQAARSCTGERRCK